MSTISADAKLDVVYQTHPPMRPLHRATQRVVTGTARYADAAGGNDVTGDGSVSTPWKTINHALRHLRAGDTLCLRGGVYYEQVYVARVGQAEAPITIRSQPGEVAIIDGGGCPEFTNAAAASWEPAPGSSPGSAPGSGPGSSGNVPDYFRSTRRYLNRRYVFAHFAESMVGLLHYYHREDIEETARTTYEKVDGEPFPAATYLGPGVWYDAATGHVYCRLSHTNYEFDTPGAANYRGVRDPRKTPLVVTFYGSLPLYLDGAEHVVLQDLVIRGAGEDAVKLRGCMHVTFDNVTVYCGTYGLHSRSSGPVKILHSGFYGSVPPWHVHAGQCLRVYSVKDRMPNGKPPTRDVCRLNTHVILSIEGRVEDQVDYCVPSNHDWELAYTDFTDSLDGIHLGGNGVRFHHNRIDRCMDDALYLTPLTPGVMQDVHVFQNLFVRCMMSFGFGGLSEPGGPVYIYRNIVDQRAACLWAHGRPAWNQALVTHFRGPARMGEIHFYHNTVITLQNSKLSDTVTQDLDRTYAHASLAFAQPDVPRRVFNNLFVSVRGMIPPSTDSLPPVTDDVQIDGNVHFDPVRPERSAAKFAEYLRSPLFQATQSRYAPGWESSSRVGDPRFVAFALDQWVVNDYRIDGRGAATGAGVPLPASYVDPLRPAEGTRPDAGALPAGVEGVQFGRTMTAEARRIYQWLERVPE